MRLKPALSAYLDFLRFSAALAVMLAHMAQDGFDMAWMPLIHFSHEAVVIFFVMSGFIIHTSTAGRGGTGSDYAIARASRIYSVAVPGIIFSVVLAALVDGLAPQWKSEINSYRSFSVLDIVGCLLFSNESWASWRSWGTQLTLNGPYWSLCYEVWYYVIFGLFFFIKTKWRWLWAGLACVISGPAIMALFPIWCLGAWYSARRGTLPKFSKVAAWVVFAGSLLLVVIVELTGIDNSVKRYLHNLVPGYWRLEASQRMFTDYVVGLAVVLNIHAFESLQIALQSVFERHRRILAELAGFSFTLYLFHRPLTEILGAAVPKAAQTIPVGVAAAALVLLTCWLMSFVTERRLPAWRRWLTRLAGKSGVPSSMATMASGVDQARS